MIWLLCLIEKCFPLVPELPAEERWHRDVNGCRWIPSEQYYCLDDPSPCRRQRWLAVLRCDRNAVSFWRKRERALRDAAALAS